MRERQRERHTERDRERERERKGEERETERQRDRETGRESITRTLAPIWLLHWPAWRWTISRMFLDVDCVKKVFSGPMIDRSSARTTTVPLGRGAKTKYTYAADSL